MEKQRMTRKADEIIRERTRGMEIVQTAEVLNQLTESIAAVEVDVDYLEAYIRNLFRYSDNPINGLLGIFGLRIIRRNADMGIVKNHEGRKLPGILKLDEHQFSKCVEKIAQELADYERETYEKENSYIEKINTLAKQLSDEQMASSQLRTDSRLQLGAVASRVQYVLGQAGEENREDPNVVQMYELMTDLNIKVLWNADEAYGAESAQFTTLEVENSGERKNKPCLVYRGEVLVKGTKFTENSK